MWKIAGVIGINGSFTLVRRSDQLLKRIYQFFEQKEGKPGKCLTSLLIIHLRAEACNIHNIKRLNGIGEGSLFFA
ncbi:hypothetical protein ACFO4N_10505 [Camelliibacillus cellulosilyticus]|uniref:Uncharacterized protein n=1 Tax=Camelliibacillus cellulosilyticus TaxID=2174486 RepID=A0ABV9GR67_9BACL